MDGGSLMTQFLANLESVINDEHIDQLTLLKTTIQISYYLLLQFSQMPSLFKNIKEEMDRNLKQSIQCFQGELKIMKENQANIQKQILQLSSLLKDIKEEMNQNINKTQQCIQDDIQKQASRMTSEFKKDMNEELNKQQYYLYEIPLLKGNQQIIIDKLDKNRNLIKFPQFIEKPKDFESDIFKACKEGKLSSVQWLIEIENVDENKKLESSFYPYSEKDTLLHIAAGSGHLQIVQYLIEKQNVYVDIKGHANWAPLDLACQYGHLSIVEYLISKGANVNTTPWTPLHVAAFNGRIDIVKYLISKGADKSIKYTDGRTPYDAAQNEAIRNILK